jgi:2-methylisocitrate lyase-like PEP mutase family enzyme
MGQKEVVPIKEMVSKVRAALAARKSADTFIIARTDGRSAENLNEAIRRAEVYRDAGADGVYVKGLKSAQRAEAGKAPKGTPLATTLMEGEGSCRGCHRKKSTPYGFQMIMYPTTVLFQMTRATERALASL